MTEPRERIVRRIFDGALDRSEVDRPAYLAAACAADPALQAEVESLLMADSSATGRLDRAAAPADLADPLAAPDPMLGRDLGPWRILRLLGRGGMGSVYLAERRDAVFEGQAAIKVIRRGMDSDDILERFRHERRVLARLQHPHIARLLDGGSLEDGLPFFVMEYVDGVPIDRYCDTRNLPLRERLELFLTVCAAVQYAHQNLVVHRDLKPANILVTDDGQTRLLDFGIAKVLTGDDSDPPVLTRGASGPFTPHYASPEQLRGVRVTTASDVYSLGIVLFELLVGSSPFAARTPADSPLERTIAKPSQAVLETESSLAVRHGGRAALARSLAGDLDAIVLAATRGEPERRYQTARELADDLRRYLDARPVRARRGALAYRLGKYVRRNALAVSAAAVAALALLAGATLSTALYLRARAAQVDAERERAVADEVSRFLEGVLSHADPHRAQGRDVAVLREILDVAARRIERELSPGTAVAGALHLSMGTTYRHLASFDPAQRHLLLALATFEADPALDPSRLVRTHHELGNLYLDTSRYADAETHLARALAIADRAGSRERQQRVDLGTSLGQLEEARGRPAEAEARYREAIAATRALHGDEDLQVAAKLSDLAVLLMNHQRRAEADTLLRAAIGIWRAARVPFDSLELATGLHNLAGLLRRQSAFEEAALHYREALEIYRRMHGAEHPDIAVTLNMMGSNAEMAGRLVEAEPYYREALAMQRRLLGDMHRDVGTTTNNLAGLMRKQGRLDEADGLFQDAARIYRAALGEGHPWLAIVLTNHAATLELMGDWARLGPTVEQAMTLTRKHFPAGHWQHAILASLRGAWLGHAGRYEEAERLLTEGYRALADSLGTDHSNTRDAERRLRTIRTFPARNGT